MTDRDPLAWETLDDEVAYDCPGFEVITESVRLPDGTEASFDYVTEGDSVVVLPFTAEGDVVVVDEWRQAVERVSRGLPAGGVEPGDADLAATARRELAEETGYEAGEISHLTTVEPANGFADAVFHYFVARECTPSLRQRLDADESIRADAVPFAELRRAALSGDLRDGRSLVGVLFYALARKDPPE